MSIFSRFSWSRFLNINEVNHDHYKDEYLTEQIGNIRKAKVVNDLNMFVLTNCVPELFFPVDFHADRISKLRFYIADKNGVEIPNTELNRFVSNGINPLYSFSDLIYQYVFSLLGDGNAHNYLGVPGSYAAKEPTENNISRWDVLTPYKICIDEMDVSTLDLLNWNDAIKRIQYEEFKTKTLDKPKYQLHNFDSVKREFSNILSVAPLMKSKETIEILLAVYSARYNVYANNGAAGYISKKTSGAAGQNLSLEAILSDSNKRDEIIKDIKNRNGLTGNRNIFGVSGIPIEFVKTLATIQELQPFDETLESSIKIASILQIPPVLVPRKDQSTYDNQSDAEKNVWENATLPLALTVCENLTKLFRLSKGNKIMVDFLSVKAISENKSEKEDYISKKLDNIAKLKQLNPDFDITPLIEEIYGN